MIRHAMTGSSEITYCFSIIWSIDQITFSPFRRGEMLCSPYFRFEDLGCTEWRLVLFPKGTLREDYMSLYLHRKPSGGALAKVTVNFELGMDSLVPSLCLLRVARNVCFKEDYFWGFPLFVRVDRARMMMNTSLTRSFTIHCDLLPSDDLSVDVATDSRLDLKTLSEDLKRLRDTQRLVDVVLKSGQAEFGVHKAVLAARSSKFFRRLEIDETCAGPVPVRDVSFMSSPVLETLLFYFYSGELDVPVSEIPHELLTVAEQFELTDLVEKMRTFPNAFSARTVLNVVHKSVYWDVKRIGELESGTLSFVRIIPTTSLYVRNLGMCCQVVSDSDQGPIKRINLCFHLEGLRKDSPVFFRCKILGFEGDGIFRELLNDEHLFESDEAWSVSIQDIGYCCERFLPSITCLEFEFDICDGVSSSKVEDDCTNCVGCLAAYNDFDQLSRDFEGLQNRRDIFDVLVVCTGQTFKAHRTILAARSPVFEKMFEHNFTEKQNGVVRVTDVRSEVMQLMLSYIYRGKVDDLVYEDAMDLYEAADKYEVIVLKEKCAALLLAELSMENAHDILLMADMHFDFDLRAKVGDFLRRNDGRISDLDSGIESSESAM